MKYLKQLVTVIAMLVTASCAELEVVSPNARIEPPETRGARGWTMGGEIVPAHVYQATTNGGARPPNLTEPKTRGHADFVPNVGYSFLPFLDTTIEANVLGSGLGALVKWQMSGNGSTEPEEGSFASAIFGRLGFTHGSKSGDQKETFGDGGYNWKGSINGTYAQFGASAGYRAIKWLLVYGGVAVGRLTANTKISQDATTTDAGGSYEAKDKGVERTAGAGVQFGWKKFRTFVSGNYSYVNYDNTIGHVEDMFVHAGFIFTP